MKVVVLIETLIFIAAFSLWLLDDYPEAKLLGATHSITVMRITAFSIIVTFIINLLL